MTPQQRQFLTQVQNAMTELGTLGEKAGELVDIYADRAYADNASNPIPEADLLQAFEVIPYELGVAVNILQAIAKLKNGEAIDANAAARAVINKWRNF